MAAWTWTAFTLAAVFASWLVVLQLVTVWAAYRVLRPHLADDVLPSMGEVKAIQDLARPLNGPKHKDDAGAISNSKLRGREALVHFNDDLHQRFEVQAATKDLSVALHAERHLVESALELARSRREIAHRGTEFVRYYEEARAEVRAILNQAPKVTLPTYPIKAPDFNISITHQDASLAKMIEDRIIELRHARGAFLDNCLDELGKDPLLKKLFWQAMLDGQQPQLTDAFVQYATGRAGK